MPEYKKIEDFLYIKCFAFYCTLGFSPKIFIVKGFGAEMGHMLCYKLYNKEKTSLGIGEALDNFSQLHEISLDVQNLSEDFDINHETSAHLETELINNFITESMVCSNIFETIMLNDDVEESMEKIRNRMGIKSDDMESEVDFNIIKYVLIPRIVMDYVTSSHWQGDKIFLAILEKTDENLKRAYKKFGEILSDPKVMNDEDAFRKLGWTDKKFLDYKKLLTRDADEINKNLKPFRDYFKHGE